VPRRCGLFEILVSDQMLAQRLVREIEDTGEQFQARAFQVTERSAARVKRGDLRFAIRCIFPGALHGGARRTPPLTTSLAARFRIATNSSSSGTRWIRKRMKIS